MDYTDTNESDINTHSSAETRTTLDTHSLDEATYSSLSAHGYSNAYMNDNGDYHDHAVFRSVAVSPPQQHSHYYAPSVSKNVKNINKAVNGRVVESGSNYFDLGYKNSKRNGLMKSNWKTKDELEFASKYRTPLGLDGDFVRKPPTRLCVAAISLCHVYVTLTLHNLCRILKQLFDDDKKEADYKFDAESCQWKITLYSENLDETVVSVYVYTCPGNEGTYLLEFCKEIGCAFTYSSFFGRIKSKLTERGMAYDAEGKRLSDGGSKANIFDLGSLCDLKTQQEIDFDASIGESDFYSDFSESADDLDFRSLFELYLQLATSKSLDTRLEGFKLIASELGKGGENAVKEFINAHTTTDSLSSISFLVNACQNEINGIRRCAVTALAHISALNPSEYQSLLLKAGTVKVMTELYAAGTLIPETKRQLVTVLSNMSVEIEGKDEVRKNGGKRIFHACLKAPASGKRLKEIADVGLRRLSTFNQLITIGASDAGVILPENKELFNVHVSPLDSTNLNNGGSEELVNVLNNYSSIILMFIPYTDNEADYSDAMMKIKALCDIIGSATFLTSVVLITPFEKEHGNSNSAFVANVTKFAKRLEKDTDLHFAEKYSLIMNSNSADNSNSIIAESFEGLIELMKESLPGLEGFRMSNSSSEEASATVARLQSCQLWLEDLRRNLSSTRTQTNANFTAQPGLNLNVYEARAEQNGDTKTRAVVLAIFERLKWITAALESSKHSKLHGVGARWDLD